MNMWAHLVRRRSFCDRECIFLKIFGHKKNSAGGAEPARPIKGKRRGRRVWLLAVPLALAGAFAAWLAAASPWSGEARQVDAQMAVSPADTRNFLVVLTDPDTRAPQSFALVGLSAPDARLTVAPLPPQMRAGEGGTLTEVFEQNGSAPAAAACQAALGVPVDYYWVQDSTAFAQAVDLFGGVDCTLPYAAAGKTPSGAQVQLEKGAQHLNGVQAAAAAGFAQVASASERYADEGAVFQALLLQKCTGHYLDQAVFGPVFDLSRTSFSMNGLLSLSRVLKKAAEGGRVDVLLPSATEGQDEALPQADVQRIRQAMGSQHRVYAP